MGRPLSIVHTLEVMVAPQVTFEVPQYLWGRKYFLHFHEHYFKILDTWHLAATQGSIYPYQENSAQSREAEEG